MTPEPTSPAKQVPCSVCGNQIQELPEHLYQFRNQTGNSVLFIQKTDADPIKGDNGKHQFNPSPICLSCVLKITGKFVVGGVQEQCKIVSEPEQQN
jgi:hypothetical protein